MALPSTLLRSRNTCRTIVVRKIATGTSGIEYAPLLDRGTAYGRELLACQDQGDRRDWRDAFARRPDRQDARGAPGQPEASWPRGPVHRAHGRGKAASRGGARRQRSLELSRAGSRLAEGPPLSRGGEPRSGRDRAEPQNDHGQDHDREAAKQRVAIRADEDLGAAQNERG